jgi:hypothetical protein
MLPWRIARVMYSDAVGERTGLNFTARLVRFGACRRWQKFRGIGDVWPFGPLPHAASLCGFSASDGPPTAPLLPIATYPPDPNVIMHSHDLLPSKVRTKSEVASSVSIPPGLQDGRQIACREDSRGAMRGFAKLMSDLGAEGQLAWGTPETMCQRLAANGCHPGTGHRAIARRPWQPPLRDCGGSIDKEGICGLSSPLPQGCHCPCPVHLGSGNCHRSPVLRLALVTCLESLGSPSRAGPAPVQRLAPFVAPQYGSTETSAGEVDLPADVPPSRGSKRIPRSRGGLDDSSLRHGSGAYARPLLPGAGPLLPGRVPCNRCRSGMPAKAKPRHGVASIILSADRLPGQTSGR